MNKKFDAIKAMYEESFIEHGDSPAALLTPKGRHSLRFRAIDDFIGSGKKTSVLDYGCGLGYLYEYLCARGFDTDYNGVDIMPSFIDACREKFDQTPKFNVIQPDDKMDGKYDVVFSSGVFNIRLDASEKESKEYAFSKIEELFSVTGNVLICDFLSPFVDFKQDASLHFEIDEIVNFCSKRLSRRFILRHDLLPYEFTLIAYRDSEIQRPGNYYTADSDFLGEGKKQ